MRTFTVIAFALSIASTSFAQSKDDKRASLAGIANIAFKETGVAALGGGTAGSPYALQVEKAFKAAGIHVADLEGAPQKGVPVYEVNCASMETAEAKVAVACES